MEKSPSSSPLASTNTKRSFQRKKLQYQERITEQQLPSPSFLTAPASVPAAATTTTTTTVTTLMPNYLTTDSIRKVSPSNISHNFGDKQIKKKEMELKAVGKLGMVKRKQFLQKRDISRSHEIDFYFEVYFLVFCYFN
ncbi:unnamed protein product [Adineta steineri]|uniref:Uncharacterized protein n=1 Tax=Adineta steineri TaxID=433720 RepID=A0A819C9Z0_9BILA|nr:unnamed protein product [Adineta steineri]CAF3816074.1 unnamed protein product [Adineta steineri]